MRRLFFMTAMPENKLTVMQIAIIGYGKMGREIETAAREKGYQIVLTVDKDNTEQLDPEILGKADVALEFTTPETAEENIIACFNAGVPVVCGTTGWTERLGDRAVMQGKESGTFLRLQLQYRSEHYV
jgi:4-hydroxy-tetrahydrodipicolinate reductase